MNTRTPQEIGHLWFEKLWNQRDQEMIHELMAPDAVGYLEGGAEIVGPQAFIEFQDGFLSIMPDLRIEVVESICGDQAVCLHWLATGTHSGEGLGLRPTGRSVTFRGTTWLTVENGKVVGGRDFWNKDGLMKDLTA